MRTISGRMRVLARVMTQKEREALEIILKTPGWESKIKDFFENREAGLKEPFLAALLLLSQTAGATAPEQLIDFIKTQTKQEQLAGPTKADLEKLRQVIPYDFGVPEKVFLSAPVVDQEKSFSIFKHQLEEKVKKGMKKNINPYIAENPKFRNMPKSQISQIVTQEFLNKVDENKKEKELLISWLSKVNRSMDDVKHIVQNTINTSLII